MFVTICLQSHVGGLCRLYRRQPQGMSGSRVRQQGGAGRHQDRTRQTGQR